MMRFLCAFLIGFAGQSAFAIADDPASLCKMAGTSQLLAQASSMECYVEVNDIKFASANLNGKDGAGKIYYTVFGTDCQRLRPSAEGTLKSVPLTAMVRYSGNQTKVCD